MRRCLLALAALIVIATLLGCPGRRFDPFWLINKFRVMSVRSSLPELRPGDVATLDALVHAPQGEVEYQWQWCPFDVSAQDYYRCPITKEELQAQIEANLPEGIPAELFDFHDFDLGEQATVEFPYPAQPAVVRGLCEAIQSSLAGVDEELAGLVPQFDCTLGFDVTIRLVARSGDEEIVASKTVRLWTGSDQEQNLNPRMTDLQIRPKHVEDVETLILEDHDWVAELAVFEDEAWYTIPEDEPVPVLAGVRYELRAVVDPGSVQVWQKPAPQGSQREFLDPAEEVFLFRWLLTAGALDEDDAIYVAGRNTLLEAGRNEFFMPTNDTSQQYEGFDGEAFLASCPELDRDSPDAGCEVTVWTVVRDDRLGVDWIARSFLVTGIKP